MPYLREYANSPRIARMLRELEGPDSRQSDAAADAASPARTASGRRRNLLFRAVAVISAAIVVVLGAMQMRAPVGDDKHAAPGTTDPARLPADSGQDAQTALDTEQTKAG